jgi:hypothetical protein
MSRPVFVMGQASRPALGETVAKHRSLSRGFLPCVTARRAPLYRLTGGSGRVSDPHPSFHQVTARNSRQLDRTGPVRHYSPFVIHGTYMHVGDIAVFPHNRIRQSQTHVLEWAFKRPDFVIFKHRLFPSIDLPATDTDGNRENVTLLRPLFITQLTNVHFETRLWACYCRAVPLEREQW